MAARCRRSAAQQGAPVSLARLWEPRAADKQSFNVPPLELDQPMGEEKGRLRESAATEAAELEKER
jgi:hypothetical protein